ncbi:M24 family metallopeptidase [Nostoc sp. CENA67]|uniref:M24 family metallopeptidase n=1 Tax=Amazonocrinis nigriterrae CENA67 TaxID=2794033 RepID=A0A8J7L4Z4_9NOST|nr:M24 family metallopeptidase [Amazonocrinis nigriterrae]MBH8560704.1 M24 family metallopeptidase [Amazonocrinis nigriterrae CENA67]
MNNLLCTDSTLEHQLISARNRGLLLIEHIKIRNLIQAGCQTREVQKVIYELAAQVLDSVDHKPRFWHRQILRVGEDTINPYSSQVKNNVIQPGDIVFFDLGTVLNMEVNPVLRIETDLGRSMIVPGPNIDPDKVKICNDCERIFLEGKAYYLQNQDMTGKDLYEYISHLARSNGWQLSSQFHSGHLIGVFPHERILGNTQFDYICLENTKPMSAPDKFGNKRYWILETHLVHPHKLFGAFYEDLLL